MRTASGGLVSREARGQGPEKHLRILREGRKPNPHANETRKGGQPEAEAAPPRVNVDLVKQTQLKLRVLAGVSSQEESSSLHTAMRLVHSTAGHRLYAIPCLPKASDYLQGEKRATP